MKNQKQFHTRLSPAAALARAPLAGSLRLGLAVVFASALTASADLDGSNLAALSDLYGSTANSAYGGISSIFGVSLAQIATLSPAQLQQALNAGIASGQGINFGKGTSGINTLSGAHALALTDAAAISAAYAANHNIAELVANLYGAAGVNLQTLFASLNGSGPTSTGGAISSEVFQTMVLDQIKTVDEQNAAAAGNGGKNSLLNLHPVAESIAFFEQSDLKGGGTRDLSGVNLSLEGSTERTKFWATVPLQWTTFASSTYMTYGVDVGAKYELIPDSGLYLGAHGNYLANSGEGSFGDYTWETGPFIGYTYKFNDKYSISTGVLADYTQPQLVDATWLGGFGADFGVRLTDHVALNTYYTYWRNLGSENSFLGTDWHDVGVDVTYTLGHSWRLVAGAKTSLGYEEFDYDYEVHLGAGWQF